MKNFLIKILLYVIIILTACYSMQFIIDEGLKRHKNGIFADWDLIFQGKINSNIVILGSSRASGHFNPTIIESKTGLSCYNLGIGAGKINLEEARWQSLLKYNNPPKIVIQNVDIFSLHPENNVVYKEQFLPFLSEPTILSSLKKIDNNVWLENIIPLYKYRGYRKLVFQGSKAFFNRIEDSQSSNSTKGYYSFKGKWNNDFENFKKKNKKAEFSWEDIKTGIVFLKSMIEDCKKKHIEIILVHTPMYFELQNIMPQKDQFDSIIVKLAKDYNIYYLDYSKDPLSYKKEYFYNSQHLNEKSADLFTEKLADSLKNIISIIKIKR